MPKGPLELLRLCSARGACMPRGSALQFSPQKQVPTPVHAARITLSQSDGRAVPARPSTTDAQQRALPSSTTKRVHFGARRFALLPVCLHVCVAYSSSSGFCRRHAQHRTNFVACFNVFPPEIAADPALQRPVLEARLRGRCERKRRGGWQTALQTASRNRTAVRRRILSFLLIRPATMRTCPPLPSVELVAPRWAA